MKKRVIVAGLLMLLISALVKAEKKDKKPLQVLPSIDLSRYSGLWYEIARLPNRFENKCVGDVTAKYAVQSESNLRVINQCRQKNGKLTKAIGEARLAIK
ncbi:MAG: lipocalin family protein, partial [Acidobacteria bacterium]|nr:lipocalin family protein [Acidobacteriota bacterium]